MVRPRSLRLIPRGLAWGFALAILISPAVVRAQPLSSGSGVGTGTGAMGGVSRNSTGTGQESGPGPRSLPSNSPMFPSTGPLGGYAPRGMTPRNQNSFGGGQGPGVSTTYPQDSGAPLGALLPTGTLAGQSTVSRTQLDYARRLGSPSDRSLALSRIASAATFSEQLDLAAEALADASKAALEADPGMVRDQRMMSIIYAEMYLAESQLREGSNDVTIPDSSPAAALPKIDRNELIRRARNDWGRSATLVAKLGNPTYRSEMTYRVADSMAYGSQKIINEFPKAEGDTVTAASGINRSYGGLPDQILQDAAALAKTIERPVWYDRALAQVVAAAAESKQFSRALVVARMIPQPEVRSDALLKIAETQARRGDPDGATASYQETAKAVASIPLDDVRMVVAGVLIDSLISVGRYDDARHSIVLYPDEPHRLIALEAVAESQGRRGAGLSALEWIKNDVPPEYRSVLYRRVNNGVVSAIESNRSRDLSNQGQRGR